ncbi:FecR family protein [Pedobacter arcticus]|uniref:FecR family protein n=1 Tax=Pedobacter arcticus TaxID=752140 RepID=UPI00030C5724|nr:FecR family protein [Pedobacter arcticus]
MKKPNAENLLNKYRLGTINDSERAILESWYNTYAVGQRDADLSAKEIEEDILKLSERIPFADSKIKRISNNGLTFKLLAAAAVLIIISIGTFFYIQQPSEKTNTIAKVDQSITPAQNKAVLTLANNEKIVLDDSSIGEIANQTGISVSKTSDGKLKYKVLEHANQTKAVQYNTISTPRGAEYQVELSDGSLVWLNASSSIKFPTHFEGDTRTVNITGEVYFEVAKNKEMPFQVNTANQLVEVLGTHFNIDAHHTNYIKTTLLEGSIKVSSGNKQNATILSPGQQSICDNTGAAIQILKVDPEKAVAWKNGYFLFADEDLSDIMEEISRWYDVDVTYLRRKKTNQKFSGTISRSKSLSQVLKVLEVSGNVNFKLDERRIIVMF